MAKRVFFSFHYRDVAELRANVVRNHGLTKDSAEFFDASLWESTKRNGPLALKRLINDGLDRTSVTCVLIGSDTYLRPWVRYELLKSFRRGNGMLGVHINGIEGKDQRTKPFGPNPLEYIGVTFSEDGRTGTLWEKTNSEWLRYSEIDGSADFAMNVEPQFRNKGFNFANWYRSYDWVGEKRIREFRNLDRPLEGQYFALILHASSAHPAMFSLM